jgi:CRP-like cAMP-binding protein
MIPDEMIEFARIYRVLSELDPQQLKKVLPLTQEMNFEKGSLLFQEGAHSEFLHLIVAGKVALEMNVGDRMIVVQTAQPGETVGWSAMSEDSITHFQARALSSVKTVAFPGKRLQDACNRDPEMGYALTKQLLALVTERLDATRMQVVDAYKRGSEVSV